MSKTIERKDCEDCGGTDTRNLFDDGHEHCFKCGDHSGGERKAEPWELLVEYTDLPKRGITEETCRRYGYGRSGSRQVAPYRDDFGRTVAQKVRTKDKKFSVLGDASKMRLWGQHLSKGGGRYLTICEGEIDCLSMSQVFGNKYAVVSVPHGAQSAAAAVARELTWVESFDKVVLCMDQDEPGREAAEEIANTLSPGKVSIMSFDAKDANELVAAGRTRELVSAFWEAAPWRPDGIMSWKELFSEVSTQEPPVMVPWNHPGLDSMTDGIQKGSVILVAGGPASGKSTEIHELVHHLAAHGERVGLISLEQSEFETVCGLMTPLVNKPLHRQKDLDLTDYADLSAQLDDRVTVYRHGGRLDAESMEETARFMTFADGCTHIILDNLSIVVSSTGDGGNERRAIDELMLRLVSLTKESGVTVIVVVHLKRPGQGKGYAEGRPVCLEDLRGSGMLEAMAYTVLSVERDQAGDDPLKATMRVLKCRHTGEAGVAGFMRYSRETGRLTPCFEDDGEEEEDF